MFGTIKIIYTHELFQRGDLMVLLFMNQGHVGWNRDIKREKCSVQEKWKIMRSLIKMGLTLTVDSTCFLIVLSSSIRWKPLSFPFHRSGKWSTQKLSIWPMVKELEKKIGFKLRSVWLRYQHSTPTQPHREFKCPYNPASFISHISLWSPNKPCTSMGVRPLLLSFSSPGMFLSPFSS